jgi:hypothetical protein
MGLLPGYSPYEQPGRVGWSVRPDKTAEIVLKVLDGQLRAAGAIRHSDKVDTRRWRSAPTR